MNRISRYVRGDKNLSALLYGAGLLYAAGFLSIGLTFLQQVTTASLLGVADYGRLAIILGSNALILLFVDFRTWEISAKLFTQYQRQADLARAANVISWYLLVDVVSGMFGILINVLAAELIASALTQSSGLSHEIRLFSLIIPFRLVAGGVPSVLLRLQQRYGWLAAKSVIYAGLRLILMSGAAWLGLGIRGVLIGAIIGEIVNAVILLVLLARVWRSDAGRENRLFRYDLRHVLTDHLSALRGLWVGGTLKGLQLETFVPILAVLTSPVQVGLYRVSVDIASMINRVIEPIAIVIQPTVIQLYEREEREYFARYLKQVTLILSAIIIPVVLGAAALGPSVFPAVLADFDGVAQVVTLLAAGFGFSGIFVWIRPAMVAMNLVRAHNVISMMSFVYSVIGLIVLSDAGALGAAFVMSTLLIGNLGAGWYLVVRKLNLDRVSSPESAHGS